MHGRPKTEDGPPTRIIALPGDGIGPEVVDAALAVLRCCREVFGIEVEADVLPVGGAAIEECGEPLPEEVLKACLESGVVLLGAVGAPRYDDLPPHRRPEKALLRLRRELGLFANLRPVKLHSALLDASPLKPGIVESSDILIVRELTGGIYFGEPRGRKKEGEKRVAYNTEVYYDFEIERIARSAFESARSRRGRVTSVDKSNVLDASQLWREVVVEVAADYPEVELIHMLVDNCAMQLIANPRQFDVILTNNMFGDILSDEAAMLTGSIGMLPSASLGEERGGVPAGLYEPVHGSAPDIAGRGIANPLAAIASLAMLFRFSLRRDDIARQIEAAIGHVLMRRVWTPDLAGPGGASVSSQEVVTRLLASLENPQKLKSG